MSTAESTPRTARRSVGLRVRDVVCCSLAFTLTAGIVAALCTTFAGTGFFVTFVCLRWSLVAALALIPAIARILRLRRIPYVFATPWTCIALTCESIVVDVICAQLFT